MRIRPRPTSPQFTRQVLDIVYVLGILALAALIALIAKGVEKL